MSPGRPRWRAALARPIAPGVRRSARGVALLSATMLVVSGLSLSALTAGIVISDDQRPAIGPPTHAFGQNGVGRDPIPRAAFGPIPVLGPAAFGGDRVYDIEVGETSYRVHEFTAVGSSKLTITRPITVEYLIVGGGGGGGNGYDNAGGGGGGAGGLLTDVTTLSGSLEVVVGGGGDGGAATRAVNRGSNGGDSRLGDLVALGGGGGSGTRTAGFAGGSGGGGGGRFDDGLTRVGGTSAVGQGHPGGKNVGQSGNQGAGGGGADGAGADGIPGGAPGGPGRSLSITGNPITYARGGDGGTNLAASAGAPGAAGRGDGGGAGSATGSFGSAGGTGGSGIVIVRYEIPRSVWGPVATGGEVSEYVGDGTDGTVAGFRYRVHTFTEDGDFVVPEGSTITEVDVLLVGGGGGGGQRHGGGGGGGGVREDPGHAVAFGTHPITVGKGGAGATGGAGGVNAGASAQSGTPSTALGLEARGGGRGGSGGLDNAQGETDGFATGGGARSSSGLPGAGLPGQGKDGGAGRPEAGGGGGGAGTAGGAASGANWEVASGGNGGDGLLSSISGTAVHYGGGGGGSVNARSSGIVGVGGKGGGGAGGVLGWEFFTHTVGSHPTSRTAFDNLFAGATIRGSSVLTPFLPSTGGIAPGTPRDSSHGPVNILNWVGTDGNCPPPPGDCQLYTVIPEQKNGGATVGNNLAFRVSGSFIPNETGYYRFTTDSDDGADVSIDGDFIAFYYGGRGFQSLSDGTRSTGSGQATVHEKQPKLLMAGQPYRFVARMHEIDGGDGLRVFWARTDSPELTTPVTKWFQYEGELSHSGRNGVDGLGGGGGGGGAISTAVSTSNAPGGDGGDGVVIIRYPLGREITGLPSGVRELIAGEGHTTAVLRWRVPALSPPSADLDGYRIERRAVGGGEWTTLTDEEVELASSGELIIATIALAGGPTETRHQFRVTPIGTVDGPSATVMSIGKGGDTVTLVGDDVVHQFATVGESSFVLGAPRTVTYLVVAGGGGGARGAGGGAGGLLSGSTALAATARTISVGAGGIGSTSDAAGSDGGSSSAFGFTATGGGGGGARSSTGTGRDGGSGGGGGAPTHPNLNDGGKGAPGQGHDGGQGISTSSDRRGGGGGGAGGSGGNAGGGRGGAAGPGLSSAITGASVGYAGGGAGAVLTLNAPGASAAEFGGGTGATTGDGGNGTAGRGGGGGGARSSSKGGSGGSGVVIVRYSFLDSGVQAGLFAATATTAVLRWEEPSEGSETITGYRVERRGPPDPAWGGATVVTPTPGTTVHTLELSGLNENADRRFRVTALHGDRAGSVTELVAVGRGGSSVRLVGSDVVHEFTAVGESSFVLGAPRTVTYLVVAGGGGGGSRHGGGGGGGGMLTGSRAVSPGTHPVTVGAGGAGARRSSSSSPAGNGGGSVVFSVTAVGGGAGFNPGFIPIGGSGGGSANADDPAEGTEGQGNDGGRGRTGNGMWAGGGGGGRGGVGVDSPANQVGGAGGAAASSTIRGMTEWFSGGGGGAGITSGGAGGGGGGVVVGGAGGFSTGATDGTGKHAPGVGGGGGAGSYDGGATNFPGGDGGSGIVVLRYALAP